MTSYSVPEDQALADALTDVVAHLERQHEPVAAYVAELRNMATPQNGWPGPAEMPFSERGKVAAALREVAANGPHPLADQLEGIANGLEQSLAAHRINGGRY